MKDFFVQTTAENFIVEAKTFKEAFHTAYEILAQEHPSASIIAIYDIELKEKYS